MQIIEGKIEELGLKMKVSDMDILIFLWQEYAKAHDKDLTVSAQDLKRQIRIFVLSLPTFKENELKTRSPLERHG